MWWAGKDSNLGSRWQQIYSLPPLATWVPARNTLHSAQQIQVLNYDCLLHPHDEKRRAGWSAHISPLLIKRMKAVSRGHSLVQETLDSIDEVWRCQDPKAELSCFFLRHPLICRNLPGTMLPGPIFFMFAFLDTGLPSEAHLSRTPRRHFMGLRR